MVRLITPVILAVILSALLLSPAAAADIEPAPTTYVEDRAGILDAGTKQQLIGLLQELERKTTARIIVLTVQTTGGQDIHSYAFERADVWKFGPKRNSGSVLFVIANADRKYRFEVGYDWEAVLPDGYVGQVGREYLVPHFRAGRPSQGVFEAAAALAQKIATDRGVTLTGMPTLRPIGRQPGSICALSGFLPVAIFILIAGLSRGRRRGMLFWGLLAGSMMGGRRGGGFGGGGFGGFGGGGGGGFGGGGASGGW